MKKITITLPLFALILGACEKEIKLKEEEVEPRIVVNSLFEAGDTIWVDLSESRNILYEGTLPKISNADAKLLDGNGAVIGAFIMEEAGKYYTTDVFPVAGSQYGISVNAPGLKSVKATSETPALITEITVDTARTGSDKINFKIQFTDDGSQKNYYGITIAYHGFYADGTGEFTEYVDSYFSTKEYFVANGDSDIDGERYAQEFFFKDDIFNGQTISFTGTKYLYDTGTTGNYFIITVKSMSEDLYKYKLSYLKYLEADGSPFAEPVQVYSNVEDGFGIFGGASFVSDTIYVE